MLSPSNLKKQNPFKLVLLLIYSNLNWKINFSKPVFLSERALLWHIIRPIPIIILIPDVAWKTSTHPNTNLLPIINGRTTRPSDMFIDANKWKNDDNTINLIFFVITW